MCRSCHNGLSNDEIHRQLTEALENPKFEEWNPVSINHLVIVASGENGEENKEMAMRLLEMYVNWLQEQGLG